MKQKIFLLLSFALLTSLLHSAYEDVNSEKYPDADAVLVDAVEDTTYAPDGTYVSTNEQWTKILTERGRKEESTNEISYNARYGKAEILFVKVIGTNGVERTVDVSATTKETTDNSSASSNIYDPQDRKIVCTIPGLSIGEIVHIKTKHVTTKARVENEFADISILEWTQPMLKQTVKIKAPKERPLVNVAVRNPLGNVTYDAAKQNDGSILHTWVATNSAQVFPEPDMPPLYTQVQHLRVSTAKDWRDLSKWYWNLSLPHLQKTNEAMSNEVAKLGHDIAKIYKWVSQEIRYMGLTLEDVSPGYAPHDVNITFDNRYGVCRDKAGLLVSMLRIGGFEAYPVLIHAGAKMDKEVPLPYFNHAIVAVRATGDKRANKDGYILMDPTDESSRDLLPSYLSDRSYLVACPQGETLLTSQVPDAENNVVRVRSKGTLDEDSSLLMETSISFVGINDNAYRRALLRRKPEERKKMFEGIVRKVAPGAELLSCEISPKDLRETESVLSVKLLFKAPESLLRGETRDELVVPQLSKLLGIANFLLEGSTSLEKRKYTLQIPSTAKVDEKIEINLSGVVGEKLFLPDELHINGSYSFDRKFDVKDGVLFVDRVLAINGVEFSPKEYDELREEIKKVEAAERKRPIFGKNNLADANVRIKKDVFDIRFSSPTSWVSTNTIEKEILTYDGKKRSSEITYTYHPNVGFSEIVNAYVTSKDGKITKVSEKEINTFDCSWAASAPRYPASKKVVVNLPSVEIGSTITYTRCTSVTNSPVAYRGEFMFDSVEPTDEKCYSWGDGDDEKRQVKNVKRIKAEGMTAPQVLWRDCLVISKGDFETAAKNLTLATKIDSYCDEKIDAILTRENGVTNAIQKVRTLRDWMRKNIRLVGPGLYDVPLSLQLTDPKIVLQENYATRLDYMRTMCALLKGMGLDADILFADSSSKGENPEILKRDLETYPRIGRFNEPICRVRIREGGFLFFGGREYTIYIATENEYTPLGISNYEGCLAFDSKAVKFITVESDIVEEGANEKVAVEAPKKFTISVRENGSVDIDYVKEIYGSAIGGFRKKYTEMLPEDRRRHFQEIIGAIAQAAVATRELETDVKSYPARTSYSAYVPNYAMVSDDAITLNVPGIGDNLFPLVGSVRENPIGISSDDDARLEIEVRFPQGYTIVEHLPQEYSFSHPCDNSIKWYDFKVTSRIEDNALIVNLVLETNKCSSSVVGKDYFMLLKDWGRLSSCRANRTIVVRRK